jgi:putative toxin-antitoxin system antitoxin component (TIGR02293 family)
MSVTAVTGLLGGTRSIVGGQLRPTGTTTVKFAAVEELARRLDLSAAELLAMIRIEPRTALRRRAEGRLRTEEADRLLRVARVVARARSVFGSLDKARRWLKRENRVLGGAAPVTLLGTDLGAESVGDELGRIEFGDFA